MTVPGGAPTLSYNLEGGPRPGCNEVVQVSSDGSTTLWRSVSTASTPPTPVGRFATRLDEAALGRLRAAVPADPMGAGASGPADIVYGRETIGIGDALYRVDAEMAVEGPWVELVRVFRELLVSVADHPAAAIALETSGPAPALVLLGSESIEVDLSNASLVAGPDTWPVGGPREVTAGPGWHFDLPQGDGGDNTAVSVQGMLAFNGRSWRNCSLTPTP